MNLLLGFECEGCGAVVFPRRALCPHCGAGSWRERVLDTGTIEETTVHRGTPIASVRVTAGPVVLARSTAATGTRVSLEVDQGGAVTARATD